MSRPIRPPNVTGWPQATVAVAAIVTGPTAVILLVRAGVPIEAIGGFVAVVTGLFAGQFAVARKTTEVDRKTEAQNVTLATIQHQVNGGLKDTVAGAVSDGIATGMEASRNGEDH